MAITKINGKERDNNGVVEVQLGPFWTPRDKAALFKKKARFEGKDQVVVVQALFDKYLSGEVAVE